jgi:hypothetical protein
MGPRYDALMTALEAVCEREEIDFTPRYSSLRAWGRAQENLSLPTSLQREATRAQFVPVLDALDGIINGDLLRAVDDHEIEGWPAIDAALEDMRSDYALSSTVKEYKSLAIQCREVFVRLADLAYEADRHGPLPETKPGGGTVVPRLEAVISREAGGASEKEMRALTVKSLALANKLQHSRSIQRWKVASMLDATTLSVALIRRLIVQEK